jgi:hypothetical protein
MADVRSSKMKVQFAEEAGNEELGGYHGNNDEFLERMVERHCPA